LEAKKLGMPEWQLARGSWQVSVDEIMFCKLNEIVSGLLEARKTEAKKQWYHNIVIM